MIKRHNYQILIDRLRESRQWIQVLVGPRQVGKTTLVLQTMEELMAPTHYASADEIGLNFATWLEQQWEIARFSLQNATESILIIDEIQKIPEWSTLVKKLWDEDTRKKNNVKVVLLGSAALLIQRGLTESLAGRFEVIPVRHWTFSEMQEGFGFTLEEYFYFGGYPGAAPLIHDEVRWRRYIQDSLIETTISKDILSLEKIQKPALLKQLFYLGCVYSGKILSYQKMIGQLQDVGNTTTLAHYLDLLSTAGLLSGLQKYAGETVRQRGSSPKFQIQNTALSNAYSNLSFADAKQDREYWGQITESAIGAYLINQIANTSIELFYWREKNSEVDFILKKGDDIIAIEIKSGKTGLLSGMDAFKNQFHPKRMLLVGGQGIRVEVFLTTPVDAWFNR